jgi:uncharacterized protein (TIGR02246 family)
MTATPTEIAAELFARLEKAWNDGDGRAFAAPCTDDVDFGELRGTPHPRREVVAQGHEFIFSTIYKGSHVTYTVDDAVELGPGCLLVHTSAVLESPSGPLAPVANAIATSVLVEQAGEWRLRAFQNTLVTG